jgi:hypothetical protein
MCQSYAPFIILYADTVGSIRDAHNMLSVSWTWGVSLSHNWSKNLLSVVAKAAMNAALNVWIACSMAFT